MLLRRLYVFFIVLLVITTSFHLLKRLDEHSRMSRAKQLVNQTHATIPSVQPYPQKTLIMLGYGTIKGRGSFRRTQVQIVGRRRSRSRSL
jgi:hypothetical protein